MIPENVYNQVKNAYHVCHGAEMVRGNKKYSLQSKFSDYRCNNKFIVATLFIKCRNEGEMEAFVKKGYTPLVNKTPLYFNGEIEYSVCKNIPLSQVPDSIDREWYVWDEF